MNEGFSINPKMLTEEDRVQLALGTKEVYHVNVKHRSDSSTIMDDYRWAASMTTVAINEYEAGKHANKFFFSKLVGDCPKTLSLVGNIRFEIVSEKHNTNIYTRAARATYMYKDNIDRGSYDQVKN